MTQKSIAFKIFSSPLPFLKAIKHEICILPLKMAHFWEKDQNRCLRIARDREETSLPFFTSGASAQAHNEPNIYTDHRMWKPNESIKNLKHLLIT